MNARVEEVFHNVADLSLEARSRYFYDHGVDGDTRREVEALLVFDSGKSDILLRDISAAASRALPQLEMNGWFCGPYRLLQLIGRGGMGAVYLAERADGEVTQRLAVKLLPPGAGASQHERFLQERQILASLAHPNIARMLDAGHLEDGRPYLAMEYVQGKPIDLFAAGLSVRQKIGLFLKVCAGVAYLHRNLVVHRDLKPGNILVTADGEPKLLDFGIAKILDLPTDVTISGMQMLTPDYGSPEQVTGGTISTATDVYSLGAVLYRLMSGRPPHEFEDRSSGAIASVIVAREVMRPSNWSPELKGDLDAILLKALRKDPSERYATVEQFAEDLEAFLESRSVRARSGNAWYRARKFARRHWAPTAAAALALVSLSAGLYVANHERLIAERRFRQLRQLSNKIFDLDTKIRQLPGSTQARHSLVSASLEYLAGLSPEARGDLDLAEDVGKAYREVADIQGVPIGPNLGETARAEESLKKATPFAEMVLASRQRDPEALLLSAEIAHDRMILANSDKRNAEALVYAHQAIDRLDRLVSLSGLSEVQRSQAAQLYSNVALAHMNMHLYDDAIRYAQRSSDLARPVRSGQRLLAGALSLIGNSLRYEGHLDEALSTTEEARRIAESASYENEVTRALDLYAILMREGRILGEVGGVNLGRPGDAIAVFQKTVELTEGAALKDPHDFASRSRLATAAREMGEILNAQGQPERALGVYELALHRIGEVKNNLSARRDEAHLLASSSYALRALHRPAEARQRIDQAFAMLRATKDYPAVSIKLESDVLIALLGQADYEADVGDRRGAVRMYEQLLSQVMASKPNPAGDLRDAAKLSAIYEAMAYVYRRAGDRDKAEDLDRRRLELWRHWDRELPHSAFVQRQMILPSN